MQPVHCGRLCGHALASCLCAAVFSGNPTTPQDPGPQPLPQTPVFPDNTGLLQACDTAHVQPISHVPPSPTAAHSHALDSRSHHAQDRSLRPAPHLPDPSSLASGDRSVGAVLPRRKRARRRRTVPHPTPKQGAAVEAPKLPARSAAPSTAKQGKAQHAAGKRSAAVMSPEPRPAKKQRLLARSPGRPHTQPQPLFHLDGHACPLGMGIAGPAGAPAQMRWAPPYSLAFPQAQHLTPPVGHASTHHSHEHSHPSQWSPHAQPYTSIPRHTYLQPPHLQLSTSWPHLALAGCQPAFAQCSAVNSHPIRGWSGGTQQFYG